MSGATSIPTIARAASTPLAGSRTPSPPPAAAVEVAAALTTRRETRRNLPTRTPSTIAAPVAPATPEANPVAPATTEAAVRVTPNPGPIARFLNGLFNCDPRGRQITIYKGTHFAIPNNFGGFFVQKVQGTGTFTTDSVYDLNDEDQFDWSKFTGIAFTPLEPDRDSAMVGWRYNLTTQEFEIGPFYNVDKVRISPQGPSQIISVPAGETFDYLVDYTGVTLSYGGTTVFKPYPQGLTPNVWTAVRVSGWFGGNEVAPRTLSYFIKFT